MAEEYEIKRDYMYVSYYLRFTQVYAGLVMIYIVLGEPSGHTIDQGLI